MLSKAEIFNLTLGALLLTKTIIDPDTDTSSECRVLNVHFPTAFNMVLQDLDLDATAQFQPLELIATRPNTLWFYAYKFPVNCAFFRRIQSCVRKDRRSTKIDSGTGRLNGQKVIFTNEDSAIAEIVPNDVTVDQLSYPAGLAIAYRLAMLSAPLISGKGAGPLRKAILEGYVLAKMEAQQLDRLENSNFDTDEEMSEFVEARLS